MSRARTFADLATASEAGDLGRRNMIINGNMEVAQRATSVAVTSGGYHTVDRFNIGLSSAGRFTMSQESITDLEGFGKALKLDCTTADTSIGSTELLTLNQKFEGQFIQKMQKGFSSAKATTLSFYVKGNASATYAVELSDTDNSGRHISKTFSVTTSWNRVSLTFPGDTTGKITADNSRSLDMNIWLHAGSGYNSGSIQDSWGALNQAGRATGISSFFDSTDREFFITGVQFELGEVATPFEHETFGDNLQRCQRYFYKYISNHDYGPLGANGMQINTNSTSGTMYQGQHPITMRAAPTMAVGGSWNPEVATGTGTFALTGSVRSSTLFWQSQEPIPTSGASDGAAAIVYASGDDDAFLSGSAEL
tara:strand:- start:1116 stop:2213 length:1098 start_codon:yes stop_codon:yes gene_type:complete